MRSIALAFLLAAFAARAQDVNFCFNDTNPTPDGAPAPCANPALCPVSIPGLHYTLETVSYHRNRDVGPCDTQGAYCPTRCANSRASCRKVGREERCTVDLQGLLFTPTPRPKHAPAVVLVTGSTACVPGAGSTACSVQCGRGDPGTYPPESFCGIKTFLLRHGYVVFAIYPRGYGDSLTQSTGVYVGTRSPQQVANNEPCAANHPFAPGAACSAFDLQDEGIEDVADAVAALKAQPQVNPDRIAVLGHSLGGIRTVNYNGHNSDIRAAVAIAPGSESWCLPGLVQNAVLQRNLLDNMDTQRSPLFLLQPRNDVNLDATVELSHELGLNRSFYQAALFPRVRDAAGNPFQFGDWGHACFEVDQETNDLWNPAVLDFLRRWGVK
jgi:pimeloyl-ACP methyl ester carboxylesterase